MKNDDCRVLIISAEKWKIENSEIVRVAVFYPVVFIAFCLPAAAAAGRRASNLDNLGRRLESER